MICHPYHGICNSGEHIMRKLAYVAALAAMTFAAPAYASGEGRIEARGGIAFAGGQEERFVARLTTDH